MALGGWLAGAIYDRTGSYAAALLNGIAWTMANMAIAFWLLRQMRGRAAGVGTASPPSIGPTTRAPTA
jgi:cyanate permease